MNSTVPLTIDPREHPHVFAAAFNTGDPAELERVYERDGVLVTRPGVAAIGDARRRANTDLQALGVPISVSVREAYVHDELALLIVDWLIEGAAPSGRDVSVRGTATDVARRGPDGYWRYAIDNPWGVAGRAVSESGEASDTPPH